MEGKFEKQIKILVGRRVALPRGTLTSEQQKKFNAELDENFDVIDERDFFLFLVNEVKKELVSVFDCDPLDWIYHTRRKKMELERIIGEWFGIDFSETSQRI